MRRFFSLVFGGLSAVFVGITCAWGITQAARAVSHAHISIPKPADGTIISGMLRTIRYTAGEEEDQKTLVSQTAEIMAANSGDISASSYIVRDITRNTTISEFNKDRLVPIASLTKLVTATLARKYIPATTRITVTSDVINTFGNTADFREGETFTASDLMYPLLMVSSNDAAEAFAQSYGRTRFVKAMNDFAQSIGAYRTYFADPSGLSPQNESTASDMALILEWIYEHDPTVFSITELKTKTVHGHTWTNPAHFLSWSYYLGGKNGYTDEAKRTTAGLFQIGPHNDIYAVVVLGSDNRDNDIVDLLQKIQK